MNVPTNCREFSLELAQPYWHGQQKLKHISEGAKSVANKAIERAILDGDVVPVGHLIANGDVVPTGEIVELMCKAYDMRYQTYDFSFKQNAEFILKQYLEKLK